jgi:hypothetical protein
MLDPDPYQNEYGSETLVYTDSYIYRKVVFDLAVQGEPFIVGLESLEQAITSFIHVCFVADIQYPKV